MNFFYTNIAKSAQSTTIKGRSKVGSSTHNNIGQSDQSNFCPIEVVRYLLYISGKDAHCTT